MCVYGGRKARTVRPGENFYGADGTRRAGLSGTPASVEQQRCDGEIGTDEAVSLHQAHDPFEVRLVQ